MSDEQIPALNWYRIEQAPGLEEIYTSVVPEEADLIGSKAQWTEMHYPIFDLDFPAQLIPSSTPGHYHLYIGRPCTWRQYKGILRAMVKAGLIEQGWYNHAKKRKEAYLRSPLLLKRESPREDPEMVIAYQKLIQLQDELATEGMSPEEEERYWRNIRDKREKEEKEAEEQELLATRQRSAGRCATMWGWGYSGQKQASPSRSVALPTPPPNPANPGQVS